MPAAKPFCRIGIALLLIGLGACRLDDTCVGVHGSCMDLTLEGEGSVEDVTVELFDQSGTRLRNGATRMGATFMLPAHVRMLPPDGVSPEQVKYLRVSASRADGFFGGGQEVAWTAGTDVYARVALLPAPIVHQIFPTLVSYYGTSPVTILGQTLPAANELQLLVDDRPVVSFSRIERSRISFSLPDNLGSTPRGAKVQLLNTKSGYRITYQSNSGVLNLVECASNADCNSHVCAKDDTLARLPSGSEIVINTCVPESRILRVEPACQPNCSVQNQVNMASMEKPYVVIGNVESNTKISIQALPPSLPILHIIGDNADYMPIGITRASSRFRVSGGTAIEVGPGANVVLDGVSVSGSATGLLCDSQGMLMNPVATQVTIRNSVFASSSLALQSKAKCDIRIDRSWFGDSVIAGLNTANQDMAIQSDSTALTINNTVFYKNGKKQPALFGGIRISDAAGIGNVVKLINNTFYGLEGLSAQRSALMIDCVTPPSAESIIVNNIFVNDLAPAAGTTYVGMNCRSPATVFLANGWNEVATAETIAFSSAMFVAPETWNLRLKAEATEAARLAGNRMYATGFDLEGLPRNPLQCSLGAFQYYPD